MIWYARERPHRAFISELIAAAVAIFIVAPIAWLGFDNDAPWIRLSGTIEPTNAGGLIYVHWKTTPLHRRCHGSIQVEIISVNDSSELIWPTLSRSSQTGQSRNVKLGQTSWDPPGWPLSRDVPPGPTIYRVTSFWYCNWVQEWFDSPITQIGPDIMFITLPEDRADVSR